MHRKILHTLQTVFKLDAFRPLQQEIITGVFLGQTQLAILPTGAGKSLCYQLPALLLDAPAVVISPLLALMKDQVDRLQALGVGAYQLSHWDSLAEQREVMQRWRQKQLQMVFLAPERLQHPEFVRMLPYLPCGLVVVDEAHSISEWGHDFRPDYRRIQHFHAQMGSPPLLALTATATADVEEDILRQLGLNRETCRVVHGPIDRPNIHLGVDILGRRDEQMSRVVSLLREERGAVILYANTRKQAEWWARALSSALNEPVGVYHAGLERAVRTGVQENFSQRLLRLVVATTAFGMGIDRADVRGVVNLGVPESIDAYSQEWGRAGRDDEPAWSRMVITRADVQMRRRMIEQDRPEMEQIAAFVGRLRALPVGRPIWWTAQEEGVSNRDLVENGVAALEEMGQLSVVSKRAREILLKLPEALEDWVIPGLFDRVFRQYSQRVARFDAMKSYIDAQECRRRVIHRYFQKELGAASARCCDYCDRERSQVPDAAPLAPLGSRERAAEAALRAWRKEQAEREQVPPYIIFNDRVLRALCERWPQNLAELAGVPGMGPVRLSRYGDSLLAVFSHQDPAVPASQGKSAKEEAWLLFGEGRPLSEVALRVGRQPSTVVGYLEAWIGQEGGPEAWRWYAQSVVPEDTQAMISRSCQENPDASLRQLFEQFHGTVSFDVLRIGRAVCLKSRSAAHAGG